MQNIDQNNNLGSPVMKPHSTFSPISLRYIAALRGNKPKKTGTEFAYADVACHAPEELICLAASNPEGRFYGLVADDNARRAAEEQASQRGTFNVVFLVGTPSETLARLTNGSSLPPMLDYLCCDETAAPLSEAERAALFDLAQKRLKPSGLFARSYRAYDCEDGAMRFLVRELAPEMNEAQKLEFLPELKKLGTLYLSKNPALAAKLDDAIAKKAPQEFFAHFDAKPVASATVDTLVAMSKRGFAYAGDANLASNYVELAVPAEAQDIVVSSSKSPLYELVKDLALNRTVRSDIWINSPTEQSSNPAELFGGFAYGIVVPRETIPTAYSAQSKIIDLSGLLYAKLVNLMSVMPIGVGDVMAHATGQTEKPEKILEALQVLVACGYASPMRGTLTATNSGSVSQPRLVGNFNRYLDKTSLTDKDVLFASQVTGCGVTLPASEAFVIQALNRAGLNNSVSALMPELSRIANTPAALSVIKTQEPTQELAHDLIRTTVGECLPQWYAYALLEAA